MDTTAASWNQPRRSVAECVATGAHARATASLEAFSAQVVTIYQWPGHRLLGGRCRDCCSDLAMVAKSKSEID